MLIFGREEISDFATASRREWLLTDGLGAWASGTVWTWLIGPFVDARIGAEAWLRQQATNKHRKG